MSGRAWRERERRHDKCGQAPVGRASRSETDAMVAAVASKWINAPALARLDPAHP